MPTGSTSLANAHPPGRWPSAVHWLYYTVDTELLMKEITDSTTRISTLARGGEAVLADGPLATPDADLRDLLDSTLVMLAGKIPPGITVVKEYDESLPVGAVVPRGAQPGVDEPDRQRGAGHG